MFAPTQDEITRLLSGIKLESTWGKRLYLMILFLCHTGLRIGEMTRLQVQHVADDQGDIRDEVYLPSAITKTRRSRTVPFNSVSKRCVQKLLEFNQSRGFSTAPEAPLFPWKDHGCLPIREAERAIQQLRERVGLSARVTPHAFRHYFATRLVLAGVDLATLQSLLGHKSLTSTEIYTHTTEERRREAVELLIPV